MGKPMLGEAMPAPDSGDEGEKKKRKKKKKELNVEEEMQFTETLKAEREIAEHKKLQVAAGLITEAQADRLDWMYEQGIDADETELMNSVAEIGQNDEAEKLKALK